MKLSNRKLTIHQFHYSVSSADAVTNQMRFIRNSLAKAGIEGEAFAKERKGDTLDWVRPFTQGSFWDADLLLLHHSHGNPALADVIRAEIPKALVYHNITPAAFFKHDPYVAELCDLGRSQLLEIKEHVIACFADSKFNAFELEALGFGKSTLFPLLDLEAKLSLKRPIKKPRVGRFRQLLFVGKLTPHKNQALLLKAMFSLREDPHHDWHLVLVGREDAVYGPYLKLLTRALGLSERVTFAGAVSDTVLTDYYRTSDAFVCASEHEGFCLPLVEAMAEGLPVLALPTTGIKETLGGAGVRLRTRRPAKIAAVIEAVLENRTLLDKVIRRQNEQLQKLALVQNGSRIPSLCVPVIERMSLTPKLRRETDAFGTHA